MSRQWRPVRLGEILDVKHGYAFESKYFSAELTGRPIVVNIGNFAYTGGLRFASTLNREFLGTYPSEFELSPGDLLVVMTCQTAGGEILGIPGVVPSDGRTYLHNQRIGKVEVDAVQLDETFAYYLFLMPEVNRQLASTATGTKILHTSPQRIREVRILLPSLPEQRAIAEVLHALDDKIHANESLTLATERLAISHCVAPQQRVAVGELATAERRQLRVDSFAGEIVDHFSLPAVDTGTRPERCLGSTIKSNKLVLGGPRVLVSRLNPHIPRIWHANPDDGVLALASTEFAALRPNGGVLSEELWAACSSPDFIAALQEKVTGTTGSHQRVRPEDVLRTEVLDPRELPMETRQLVSSLVRQAASCRKESFALAKLRDALLRPLLSGRLRVRDAETLVEEPV